MKKRIKNIKNTSKSSITSVVLVGMITLAMAGCSLVEVNQETVEVSVPSTETDQSEPSEQSETAESSATVQKIASLPHPDDLYNIDTLYKDEVLPTAGDLADGFYTVSMTPNYGVNDDEFEYSFYPWLQLEVSKDFLDSLEEGMILDFTGWGELNTVTVQSVGTITADPYSFLGTDYTGEVFNLSTNKGYINFCKVDGVDKWKAFKSTDEPIIMYYSPVSVSVADECIIYDAYSWFRTPKTDKPSTDVYEAAKNFTDKELTKGVTDNIRDFFDKWHFDRYDFTVIKIENNTITEVYFWHS